MTGYLGLIELLFFVTVVFGFGFWQLWQLRKRDDD